MRHKHKRVLEMNTGVVKTTSVLRNMLTSLIDSGKITTTGKKSRVLKAFADSFFSRLVRIHSNNSDAADAKRQAISYIKSMLYTDSAGKKVMEDILPKMLADGKKSGFVSNYKMWFRHGDAAEKVLVRLI